MNKKQLLTLTFAALALNAAAQPLADGNKKLSYYNADKSFDIKNINKEDVKTLFLPDMLGMANLEGKLQNAYYLSKNNAAQNRACNNVSSENIEKTLISKIKSFDLEKEFKNVKADTQIIRIDYSKVRPHMHKRKILAAVKSEAKASREIAEKKNILKRIYENFKLIAKKAQASADTSKNRDLLCLVENALYAVKKSDYISALEITKQAVKK